MHDPGGEKLETLKRNHGRWVTVGSKCSVHVTEDSSSLAADYFDTFTTDEIHTPRHLKCLTASTWIPIQVM